MRPGEPVLVTETLQKHERKVRVRVRDIVCPVGRYKTIRIEEAEHGFYSIAGGYSDVCLRGVVGQDIQAMDDHFATFLHVPVEEGSTSLHVPIVTEVPLTNNQKVSIKHGQFDRLLNEAEGAAYVFAQYRTPEGHSHGTLEIVSCLAIPAGEVHCDLTECQRRN